MRLAEGWPQGDPATSPLSDQGREAGSGGSNGLASNELNSKEGLWCSRGDEGSQLPRRTPGAVLAVVF